MTNALWNEPLSRLMHMRPGTLPALLAALVFTAAAGADRDEDERRRLLGALQLSRLSVAFEEVPARDAVARLSRAIGVPILGRYLDDPGDRGIDPETPVTFAVEEADGLTVLEMILEQCELYEPCTWQLRRGYVEVGTKERLGAPAAAETRTYPIRDMMLEPPYFIAPPPGAFGLRSALPGMGGLGGLGAFGGGSGMTTGSAADVIAKSPYGGAILSRPAEIEPDGRGGGEASKRPEELAREIVTAIIETIEPGNWDYGQYEDATRDPDEPAPRRSRRGMGPTPSQQAAWRKIARIRLIGDRLVIRAPDYIHREVDGYPPPLPPPSASDDERRARGAAASGPGATIIVHPAASPGRRTRP